VSRREALKPGSLGLSGLVATPVRRRVACVAVLAIVVAAGGAGCSDTSREMSSSFPRGPHRGRLTNIVYLNPLPNSRVWDGYGACMKQEAAKHDISVRIVGPPGGNVDVQAMQNMLSQAIAAKAQAIVTWSGGAPAAFDALFARARAQGAVVAAIDAKTKNQNFSFGGPRKGPPILVEAVAKRTGHQYVGMIWQYAGTNAGELAAIKKELRKHPNVTLVDVSYDQGKFTDDVAIAGSMLTAYPEINVLYVYNGYPGALTAIKEKHLVGKVFAFTWPGDSPAAAVRYVDEGLIGGLGVVDICGTGKRIVQRLLDAWAGKHVERWYSNRPRFVTGKEFKRLVARGYP
jgi:ABC-type sugar transport system substrate-binding protein